jgi:hypothetical protein
MVFEQEPALISIRIRFENKLNIVDMIPFPDLAQICFKNRPSLRSCADTRLMVNDFLNVPKLAL